MIPNPKIKEKKLKFVLLRNLLICKSSLLKTIDQFDSKQKRKFHEKNLLFFALRGLDTGNGSRVEVSKS